ncbi:glycoside hydrolase family 2 TIM barrel-domain containing protein [uncultured Winogradskyella sp.]|uniref:glycoside hydrolase family 2 TIM barrel-domain containing protein n=1 Tax=uncultured Winogradskyella sp. TaxID=395353 RepID=UPI002615A9A2|nr:glycoside hydrolase family 2 TIM barrel-domain containing protein [uncultured Winogradskyella sp.]
MNNNKTILRSLILISYVLIIALVIYGIAAIFSYLNTGADRSTMLHTGVKQIDQYSPELTWAPLANEGRSMDEENLKAIEDNYLDAWYVKHVAYMTNTMTGIDDFYTKSAQLNIQNVISINSESNTFIEATTLAHYPTLEFFSEDGQLAVLTDHDVIEYKRIFSNETLVAQVNEKSTYKVTLLLEDGFWRIRHLVRIKSEPYTPEAELNPIAVSNIKGINYYPQATPWDMYGDNFDSETIAKDLKIIKDSGLNSIRVFVPYDDFGKSNVSEVKLEKLVAVLDLAETYNLKVLVSLFDFYGDYSVLDWTLTQRHAKSVVNALKSHDALLGWDIKNEPNLDFKKRTEDLVIAWLDKMIDFVRSQDPNHPITIGWSNTSSATLLNKKLDFISFHYYEDVSKLSEAYTSLQSKIKDKSIVLTEYGLSSYSGLWNPFGNSDDDQKDYHQSMQTTFSENDIQFMAWTLYDFAEIPKEVVGRLPWRQNAQKHFGFIDENGIKKPSFKYISTKE